MKPLREQLQQRADYTQRFNATTGRHGWLRLTPAYSVKIVEELVQRYPQAERILDPFCGTGTTALCAAQHGKTAVTTDINPFLIWLAQAKTACYEPASVDAALHACARALDIVAHHAVEPVPTPPIFNIERWWSAETIQFLRLLRAAIECVTHDDPAARDLLLVAFCRALMELSHAAFNHQSLSFKPNQQLDLPLPIDRAATFERHVRFVLASATDNPSGTAQVAQADARALRATLTGSFDLVITSPPYANRMSYIRELRPYMYWLGFLTNGRDAGDLDWLAIGGTWGSATSRLAAWERPPNHFQSAYLTEIVTAIAASVGKSGLLLAQYVTKYVDDVWMHLCELPDLLRPGAEIHYIVGNSTFYGVVVATERLYAEMLAALGFSEVVCRPLRKRNSKKELIEFDVVARWR